MSGEYHHTDDVIQNPPKYGLSSKIFDEYVAARRERGLEDFDRYDDNKVLWEMYGHGWVKYHGRIYDNGKYEANIGGPDRESIAKVLKWLSQNNRELVKVYARDGQTGDEIHLDGSQEIKQFIKNRGQKTQSKTAAFRETYNFLRDNNGKKDQSATNNN